MRIHTIDRCLQSPGRQWTRPRLAEACNEAAFEAYGVEKRYSTSAIQRDLRFMKQPPPAGYGAPIAWDARRNTYYYREPGFSIYDVPLSRKDISAIEEALNLLRSVRYFQQEEGLEALAQKLSRSLRFKRQSLEEPALVFSHTQRAPGQQWASLIYDAALHHRCLKLAYKPFQESLRHPIVSPYLLREYNRRWFLIGYSHREHKLRTYALDRIQEAEHYLLEDYYRLPAFDPEAYFRHIIGVSLPEGQPVEKIQIRTTPLRARYIATKPIHPSQRMVEEGEEYTVFELQLIPNIELERLLLSFGEEAQVLAPGWLAERIAERLRAAADNYGESGM